MTLESSHPSGACPPPVRWRLEQVLQEAGEEEVEAVGDNGYCRGDAECLLLDAQVQRAVLSGSEVGRPGSPLLGDLTLE